jgi:hypothetical protein
LAQIDRGTDYVHLALLLIGNLPLELLSRKMKDQIPPALDAAKSSSSPLTSLSTLLQIEENALSFKEAGKDLYNGIAHELESFAKEAQEECVPSCNDSGFFVERSRSILKNWIHVPYLPAFHQPGWLLRYAVGPHDSDLFIMLYADIAAGITVSLTLIPQALSYATLANLPPINGLYAAILPSAAYTFFGTSMQLAVGPVAIVSLLVGALQNKYVQSPLTHVELAMDTAAQASLCCGIILSAMAIFNMGTSLCFLYMCIKYLCLCV